MIDISIIILYLGLTLLIGFLSGTKVHNMRDFAISHRNYPTSVIVATISATLIGGFATFGIIERVYSQGIIYLFVAFGIPINFFLVSKYLLPRMKVLEKSMSVGEMMGHYYGKSGQIITGIFAAVVSIGEVAAQVSAIGLIISTFLGTTFLMGVIIGCGIVIFYSSFGGIKSVVSTDVLQFAILIIGIPLIFNLSLHKTGGLENLFDLIPRDYFSLKPKSESIMKPLTMLFAVLLTFFEPVFVQRFLLSKNTEQAVKAAKITSLISFPFFIIVAFIGLIAVANMPNSDPHTILPTMINTYLPVSVRGFVIAGLLSVLMSTADSNLNITTVSIMKDVIEKIREKNISPGREIYIARILNLLIGTITVIIAITYKSLVDIIITSFSFWVSTILIPFMFAIFGKKLPKTIFLISVSTGGFTTLGWNIWFSNIYGFDGLIPGMFTNLSVTLILLKIPILNKSLN